MSAGRDPARFLLPGGVLVPSGPLAAWLRDLAVLDIRDRVRSGGGAAVRDEVAALCEALAAAAVARPVSADGSAEGGPVRVVDVTQEVTADEAGREVGLTGRRVRQLCGSGMVAHRMVAGRYLVDVADLRRHLRGEAAA